ncbi:hypothetical protein YC2023_116944 [Brassica napus]
MSQDASRIRTEMANLALIPLVTSRPPTLIGHPRLLSRPVGPIPSPILPLIQLKHLNSGVLNGYHMVTTRPMKVLLNGIEFFQTQGRTPASGSPLKGTPVPRIPAEKEPRFPAVEFSGSGPKIAPFLREMENFR